MMYDDNEKALIFLSQFDFMTSTKFAKVFECFNEIKEIFTADNKKLFELKQILKDKFEILIDKLTDCNYLSYIDELGRKNIKCVTILSKDYPQKLKRLKNPPYVLYYTGNITIANAKSVAIVGTRNPSPYGTVVTAKYGEELSRNNIVVVSGLASGVDACAHKGALNGGGLTIAVLGGGFDHMYPMENIVLAREIAKSGLILTEYPPKTKPTKYTFPTRNRIIAGLSDAILITEAGKNSGSLYTKDYGDEVGIDTFCVPGQITMDTASATNYLIQSGSARCTMSPKDLIDAIENSSSLSVIKIANKQKNKKEKQNDDLSDIKEMQIDKSSKIYDNLTEIQREIVDAIKNGYNNFNLISIKTGINAQNLNINLTMLQINGIIKKLAGNTYMIC